MDFYLNLKLIKPGQTSRQFHQIDMMKVVDLLINKQ